MNQEKKKINPVLGGLILFAAGLFAGIFIIVGAAIEFLFGYPYGPQK